MTINRKIDTFTQIEEEYRNGKITFSEYIDKAAKEIYVLNQNHDNGENLDSFIENVFGGIGSVKELRDEIDLLIEEKENINV